MITVGDAMKEFCEKHNMEQENNDEKVLPKLNLSDITKDSLPCLDVNALKSAHKVMAHVKASLTALVISPARKILYFEAICSSSSTAHAMMGCLTNAFDGSIVWKYLPPGEHYYGTTLSALLEPKIVDSRHKIKGWGNIHLFSAIERDGEMIAACDDERLWLKLRQRMSCPTLADWGDAIMPRVHELGVLSVCESFGLPDGMKPYVLSANANNIFDDIVGEHVRSIGGIPKRKDVENVHNQNNRRALG